MRITQETQPVTIFHLAAQIDVRRSVNDPYFDGLVNVLGTINVLEAARVANARVILASSGGAVYGEHPNLRIPTPEGEGPQPLSPYGTSKLAAEQYCELFTRLHGVPTSVLRLSNVYGPGQDASGEGGVIAIFSNCVLSGAAPCVYGDGRQTRDFVYVHDVIDAFLAAEVRSTDGAVNVSTGVEVSVLDLLSYFPFTSRPRFLPARDGEVHRSLLDPTLAQSVLGWRATTALADGIHATLTSAHKMQA